LHRFANPLFIGLEIALEVPATINPSWHMNLRWIITRLRARFFVILQQNGCAFLPCSLNQAQDFVAKKRAFSAISLASGWKVLLLEVCQKPAFCLQILLISQPGVIR